MTNRLIDSRKELVLIIITSPDRAGAQKHVISLVTGLKKSFDFTIAVGDEGYLTQSCAEVGVDYVVCPALTRSVSPFKDVKAFLQLTKLIKRLKPSLVHVHSAKAGLLGRLAATQLKRPVLYTVHGWAFSQGNGFFKRLLSTWVERVMKRFTTFYIAVSKHDMSIGVSRKILSSQTCKVIWNGVEDVSDQLLVTVDSHGSESLRILSVTRFAKQKNIPLMLSSLAKVEVPFEAVIAGFGPLQGHCLERARTLGLMNRVEFPGEITNVAKLLSTGDLYILTSDWEGLPIAVIEAMRAGLPVIATDVGGVSEIIDDGENGFLVPRGNSEELKKRITALLNDDKKRLAFSMAARKKFEQNFTIERMLNQTQSTYRKLIDHA